MGTIYCANDMIGGVFARGFSSGTVGFCSEFRRRIISDGGFELVFKVFDRGVEQSGSSLGS